MALGKELISQALQQAIANPAQCEKALKQASSEMARAQTEVNQVQSSLQTQTSTEWYLQAKSAENCRTFCLSAVKPTATNAIYQKFPAPMLQSLKKYSIVIYNYLIF